MEENKDGYIVALVYTREARGYEGVVTWTRFKNKTDFQKWYYDDGKKLQRVLEEDITSDRAIELARQTPIACRAAAKMQEIRDSFDPDGDPIREAVIFTELTKLMFVNKNR